MNFEVFLIFTYIILTVVTKKLNSYRNLKPYLSYRFYNILYGGLRWWDKDTKLSWRKICSLLNKRSVKITWRTIGIFCFPFFFLLIRLLWSRVAILSSVLVNDLFIFRSEPFFFGEQIITRSQKSWLIKYNRNHNEYRAFYGLKRRSGPKVLTGRISLSIQSFCSCWSFPLFSWP